MNNESNLDNAIEKFRNSLSTDRLDMSFGEIMNMYSQSEIIIDPNFQRLFRWDEYQKTRFIESLLIGIPFPPIFVAEDKEGKWELIDGLQRVSTVLSFFGYLKDDGNLNFKNNWTLAEGEIIKEIKDYNFKNLPTKYILNLKRTSCRVEIIKWNSAFDMRYELFNRLNTGGSALVPQEIRNAIFRSDGDQFNSFLTKNACNPFFNKLVSPTEAQRESLYMDELVLRFCSLYDTRDEIITNTISKHMNEYMKKIVKEHEKISELQIIFDKTLTVLEKLNDNDVFKGKNRSFSSSLYDCVMLGIAKNITKYYETDISKLKESISSLKNSTDLENVSGSSSGSKNRVTSRLTVASKYF